ncbi:MAG: EAL domain-containing protein, partial [Lachnospiraceae bacterium]|nr:EAL domain-containing protein [Lachnospiraceae bacterium]
KFIKDNKIADTDIEYIEVNISPVQLQQPEYYKKIIEIMEEYDVKPSQINIEITETANMVGASDVVNENIEKLVEYGITFSLDDYGSGYSNLDYINNMPFHIIKIDKFIVWDAFKNIKAGITLEYTIKMLNALQYMIVAEGVETEEQKDQLANIGCHYMQGWYYSKAVSDKEFMQLIKKAS